MVKVAWTAIGMALVVGFGGGFMVARSHYTRRFELAKQRLVGEHVTHEVARRRSDYPALTLQVRSTLTSALPTKSTRCKITVRSVATSSVRSLAQDFLELFSGWSARQVEYAGDNDVFSNGLHFAFSPEDSWGVQFEAALETTGMHPVPVPDIKRATCDWEFTFGEPGT